MKKLFITVTIFFTLMFFGCDSIPSEVIDVSEVDYQLLSVSAPEQFIFNDQDSLLVAQLTFSNSTSIANVWFNVLTGDGASSVKQNVAMNEISNNDGTSTYSGSTVMGKGIPSGQYILQFYVEDNITAGSEKIQKVASHSFQFLSGEQNSAPVISNLIAPDTIVVQDPKSLIELHISVADSNGLLDIREVFFNVFGPGATSGNKVGMFDDGAVGNGDTTPGDGVYSRIIEITPSNTKGDYRFEFEAVDKVGAISNKIIHILTVK